MRAGVYKGNSLIQTEEIPNPKPGPNQIVVRIKYSAICGSDVHGWQYDAVAPGHVLGHEFYGEIYSVGTNVSQWQIGDRVTGGGEPPPELDTDLVRGPRYNYRTQGMRRLEAVTGRYAEQLIWDRFASNSRLSADLQVPVNEVEERVAKMKQDLVDLRKDMSDLQRQHSLRNAENLLSKIQTINGVNVLATSVQSSNNDSMREIGDWLREKIITGILILGSVINNRPLLLVMVTQDLVDNGINAKEIIETVTKTIQGGGGGNPKVAQAGGRDSSKIEQAISESFDYVRSILE